jgi:hypothetical protein
MCHAAMRPAHSYLRVPFLSLAAHAFSEAPFLVESHKHARVLGIGAIGQVCIVVTCQYIQELLLHKLHASES